MIVILGEFWIVLLLSFLPGAGNFAGGMIAEFRGASPRMLSFALHAASGIVIGIIGIELLPEALGKLAGWWIAAAVAGGGVTYFWSRDSSNGCSRGMAAKIGPACG